MERRRRSRPHSRTLHLTSWYDKYDPKVEQNLPPNEIAALKSLLKDDSIIIQKSDKGNSVVILDKAAYIERVTEILADTSKFQKLNVKKGEDFNYVRNQEKRITSVLYELNKKGLLSEADYNKLKPKVPHLVYCAGCQRCTKLSLTISRSRGLFCLLSILRHTTFQSSLLRYSNRLPKTIILLETPSLLLMKLDHRTHSMSWLPSMLKPYLPTYH